MRPLAYVLKKDGGRGPAQMVGQLVTPDPTEDLHGATKQYVDARVALQHRYDDLHLPYGAGAGTDNWFNGAFCGASAADTLLLTRGKCMVTPLWCGYEDWTFDGLSFAVSTAGTASVCRLGILLLDHENGFKPTSLLVDAGTVATATTGRKTITFSAVTVLNTRWIGLAIQAEGSATPPTVREVSASQNFWGPIMGVRAFSGNTKANQEGGVMHNATVGDGAFPGSSEYPNFITTTRDNVVAIGARRTSAFP